MGEDYPFPMKTPNKKLGLFLQTSLRRGIRNIWEAIQDSNEKLFSHPNYLMNGVRYFFHNADELPFKKVQVHYAPYFEKVYFLVTPVITQIDDSLVAFSPEK
jgi:hypothetical protein